jgi:hypothetical protein
MTARENFKAPDPFISAIRTKININIWGVIVDQRVFEKGIKNIQEFLTLLKSIMRKRLGKIFRRDKGWHGLKKFLIFTISPKDQRKF